MRSPSDDASKAGRAQPLNLARQARCDNETGNSLIGPGVRRTEHGAYFMRLSFRVVASN